MIPRSRMLGRWKVLICLFFTFQVALSGYGQDYYFTHYQVENGISNNAVLNIIQDHQGFMWFATKDGLNRFDGLSFKVFRNDPSSDRSIGCNSIVCLCEDDLRTIWVGTDKGIFAYDETTERFAQFKPAGDKSITALKVRNGELWYVSFSKLWRHNLAKRTVKYYDAGKGVTAYCLARDGGLWVSTVAGTIVHYNSAGDSLRTYDVFNQSAYTVSKYISCIFETGDGNLLVGTSNQGLKALNVTTGGYTELLSLTQYKTDIMVRDIVAVKPGEYWVATQSGIFILNMDHGTFTNLRKHYNDPYSLSDNIVHTLCKDKEGGMWVGTYFGGANYYPQESLHFTRYYPKACANSISGNAVREIHPDRYGNLWIGTEDAGLNRLELATGKFTQFSPERSDQSVSYSNIHGLLVDSNYIWAGTYLHGLDVLDVKTGKRLKHYNTANSGLGSNFVYSIYKTGAGKMLFATDDGLYKYLTGRKDFERIMAAPKVYYKTVCEDKYGDIWTGTYGDGVFVLDKNEGIVAHYQAAAHNHDSLPGDIINYIFKDSSGTIWLATENGLCKFDERRKTFKTYNTSNGFPANVLYAIKEDNTHHLWISTSNGLVCFDPGSETLKVYNRAQGLLTDQFNFNAAYKDSAGRMYFGSVNGMISFDPNAPARNTFNPPVYITGFQVYNKELEIGKQGSPLTRSITYTDKVVLKHNQASFSIDFAALGFSAPASIQYVYKMDGLDNEWTYLKTNRRIYFTEMKSGSYVFNVHTINGSSMPGGQMARLRIEILPPLWLTWWAYALYMGVALLIAYFIVRYFTDKARDRNRRRLERLAFQKEKENYEDKLNFFTNVAHEIRTPLTLIKGPMENIMDRIDEVPAIRNNLQIMNRNTERLIQLTTQLLDFSKTEASGFRLSFIDTDIVHLLKEIFAVYKPVVEHKGIEVKWQLPASLIAKADPEALHKIVSNLLDNAVKYAKSRVEIYLESVSAGEGDYYQLLMKNDGFIIPYALQEDIFKSFFRVKETANQPGTGIGLSLSRSLVQLHGGTLKLLAPDGSMNAFLLSMPLTPSDPKENKKDME